MRMELAVVVAAVSVLFVACFELLERRTVDDASRLRTFRWIGGGLLGAGTLVLLGQRLAELATPMIDGVTGSGRGTGSPAAMLVARLLGLLDVFF